MTSPTSRWPIATCITLLGLATSGVAQRDSVLDRLRELREHRAPPRIPGTHPGTSRWRLETGKNAYRWVQSESFESIGQIQDWIIAGAKTDQFAFPGSLVWIDAVTKGSPQVLDQLAGRQPVTVIGPEDMDPFTHDGTLRGFRESSRAWRERHADLRRTYLSSLDDPGPGDAAAAGPFSEPATPYTTSIQITTGRTMESALLAAGISAKVWGQKLNAVMAQGGSSTSTYLLIRIDVVLYDLLLDTPPQGGYFSTTLMAENEAYLGDAISRLGEPGYVNTVKYGRTVLIAARSDAGDEASRESLSFEAKALAVGVKGGVDQSKKEAWRTMRIGIATIGAPAGREVFEVLNANEDKHDLLARVSNLVQAMARNETGASPQILSFTVNYWDGATCAIFESHEFGRETYGAASARFAPIDRLAIETNGDDATKTKGDDDMHSDDYTKVAIEYRTRVADGGRTVWLDLTWVATELEKDGKTRQDTQFRSTKSIQLWNAGTSNLRATGVAGASASGKSSKTIPGERHVFVPISERVGGLSNIRVRFDSDRGNDKPYQGFQAEWSGTIELAAPESPAR